MHRSKLSFLNGICILLLLTAIIISCGKKEGPSKDTPAKIDHPVKESDLTTITLSENAEKRLGIEIAVVVSGSLPDVLKLGGEIIAVPGRNIQIAAPAGGTVLYGSPGKGVLVGSEVKKGQEVMRLVLMPPEKDILSSQEEISVREVEYQVALATFKRAEILLKDRAISEKAYQESEAQLAGARGSLNAVRARVQLLTSSHLDSVEGNLSTFILGSPFNGVLQKIFVASGQTVPASTPLFEIAGQDPVWIRVPVYVGYMNDIDMKRPGILLSAGEDAAMIQVDPVKGPPLSDAGSATADLFYLLENKSGRFRIGQKLLVSIAKKTSREGMIIPFSSVLYDMYGGTWVYVKTGQLAYTRKRIEISHVVNDTAMVTRGIDAGDNVVTAGAVELFGTEFGGGK